MYPIGGMLLPRPSNSIDGIQRHQTYHVHWIGDRGSQGMVFSCCRKVDSDVVKVAIAATKHLTPVTLELGGKDPAIIMPRTDLKQWASLWMRGIL